MIDMGTTIYRKGSIMITRFWGGDARGTCYQINVKGCYDVLDSYEYKKMLLGLIKKEMS